MSAGETIQQAEGGVNSPMALMTNQQIGKSASLQNGESGSRRVGEPAEPGLCSAPGLKVLANDVDGGADLLGESLPLDADDLEVGLVDG